MHVDFADIGERERYKLMASLIVPRPIAFVTTVNDDGGINAAPFSMFCMLGEEPPLLLLSFNTAGPDDRKDTARNIESRGEFVVHIVDESLAAAADRCSDRLPYGESELAAEGLDLVASALIRTPAIAQAPVAFECVLEETLHTASREIVIGRIVALRAADGLIDTNLWRVNLADYFPVGRFGASFYTTTRDRFSLNDAGNGAPATSTAIDQF